MAIASRHLTEPPQAFTVQDIWDQPADGLQYELLDGMLLVNPPPSTHHELAVSRLHALLLVGATGGAEVFSGRLGWRAREDRWFEPDLVIALASDLVIALASDIVGGYLQAPPLLVVEVVSPSSGAADRTVKLTAYDEDGAGAYWVVDPLELSIDMFERPGGPLVMVAHATGSETASASHPWAVGIAPEALAG